MTSMMSFTVSTHVIAREVGDETVLLDLKGGNYFGLDKVGTRVWELMGENKSLSQICDMLMDEYEVMPPELERDILALANALADHGLITLDVEA